MSKIVFFTGAGVSVGAGLPTYRGDDGMYTAPGAAPPLSSSNATADQVHLVWDHLDQLFGLNPSPAIAHETIASLAATNDVCIVTQNIDGLHSRAAAAANVNLPVFALHGDAFKLSCLNVSCDFSGSVPEDRELATVPVCPVCGSSCRPDVVLFGEHLPADVFNAGHAAALSADVLVVVGTSLEVFPAANIVFDAGDAGVKIIWVNPQEPPRFLTDSTFSGSRQLQCYYGAADDVLPRLF